MESLDKLKAELKLRGFSPLTVRNYCFFVEKFIEKTKRNAADFNEDDVKAFLSEMFDTKSKNTTNTISLLSLQRELVVFTVKTANAIELKSINLQVRVLLSPQIFRHARSSLLRKQRNRVSGIPGCPCGNTNFRVTIQRENGKCLQ